ncbi:MAG: hypothetical protein ACRDBQ_19010 [Shewanella sp.]
MSFTSKQNLLKLINAENRIEPPLTDKDVDIGLPEVVSVEGRDSCVVLTSKMRGDEGSQVAVCYHRRALSDYTDVDNVFGDEDIRTTHDLLVPINERFNLNLIPEDFEDHPVSLGNHTIIAKADSHEWRKGAVIEVIKAIPLVDVITKTDLSGLVYPDHQNTAIGQAYVYSYPIDCTAVNYFLKLLAVDVDIDDNALSVVMNIVFHERWCAQDEPAPFNLRGAVVVFDGLTKDLIGANPEFENVVSLRLSDKCTNLQGILNLHFNP